MPPPRHAGSDPAGSSDGEAAGAGPPSLAARLSLVDVMHAVPPAVERLGREDRRSLRLLSRGTKSAVEGAISALDLGDGTADGGVLPADHAVLRRFVARLPGLQQLDAPWDAALLGQVAAARSGMENVKPVRRMELRLPDQPDLTLGADLGLVLAAFPGLEVRTPLNVCKRGQVLRCARVL